MRLWLACGLRSEVSWTVFRPRSAGLQMAGRNLRERRLVGRSAGEGRVTMPRRGLSRVVALVGSLLASVWILSGCGEVPTAPSPEGMASEEAASVQGAVGVSAAPSATVSDGASPVAGEPTGVILPERDDRASSRYALAKARM